MLLIPYIRANKEEVLVRLAIKNFKQTELIDEVLDLDEKRRSLQQEQDDLLAEANTLAKEIGLLFKEGKTAAAQALKERNSQIKEQTKALSAQLNETKQLLQEKLVEIPNLPHESVPPGKQASDNINEHQEGEMPQLFPDAVPHWDLISKFDLIDFDLGNKVTGAGFPFYKGKGARLQRALINFFLDEAVKAGFQEVQPPLMVNEDSAYGTGQLPDKEGQMYTIGADKLYMIPTAEVPITNMFRDVIVQEKTLPLKITAYSSCFRREAGSWGKHVRGLNRLHQFDKVEIVQIAHPDQSYQLLEEMKAHVAGLLRKLELPFRILKLCGGDMSFTSALTYDFEVFSAAQEMWLEVSSVSNFESFQANRMKLRIKDANGQIQLAHTLNGSALALPRIVAALLENNQTKDGIKIPKALQDYTGFALIN
ncbi:MAG: serine--tRNA ligase [Bacteroidetes bacterium]|nr:serine--tRNA ligase [Bacteroidota bacterium]MBU1579093.1 serine--tRNA ligase [Bacteroidota bacterium]MBU2465073.1 serine--tRNA ligase [Bacteroidota bacterium]MBU2613891.1 serine--tRNA ligase [Patescibacteria group bacterium]